MNKLESREKKIDLHTIDVINKSVDAKYAMISMKVILAILIRTFVFKVNKNIQINEIKLQTDMTLSPVEPIKVKIEKRDNL